MTLKAFCQYHRMPFSQAQELPLSDIEMWAVFNSIDLAASGKDANQPKITQDNYRNFFRVKKDGS